MIIDHIRKRRESKVFFAVVALLLFIMVIHSNNLGLRNLTGLQSAIGVMNLTLVAYDSAPYIILVSPPDNYTTINDVITFTVNVSDDSAVTNLTLYTNISGAWLPNQTITLPPSTSFTTVSFNVSGIPFGNYVWNVLAWDNTGHSDFAASNRSFFRTGGNITSYIDGVLSQIFNESGVPSNVTFVVVDNATGSIPIANARIIIEEVNGLSFFPMPQVSDSQVSNVGRAEGFTDLNGVLTLAIIPTGGIPDYDPLIGNYSINAYLVDNTGQVLDRVSFNILDRDPLGAINALDIPNRGNIGPAVTRSFQIWDTLNAYMNNNAGNGLNHNIIINQSGTITGINFSVPVSQPNALYIKAVNSSGVIENATINITEANGYYIFSYPQTVDSVISNYHQGSVRTNSSGDAIVVLVPTGGDTVFDSTLGGYNITISAYLPNGTLFAKDEIPSSRGIVGPDGLTLDTIPNQANIGTDTTQLIRLLGAINDRMNA